MPARHGPARRHFKLKGLTQGQRHACELLGQTTSVGDLVERAVAHAPGTTQAQVLKLVALLTGRGVVEILRPEGRAETANARYLRQSAYFGLFEREIGDRQRIQESLRTSTIAVVGIGGVGNWTAQHLVAMGVGTLVLVDGDAVERSNLNRQGLYSEADLGCLKVAVARRELHALNPDVEIRAVAQTIASPDQLESLLTGADLFVLTADKPRILLRRWASDVAWRLGLPWLNGSVDAYLLQLGPLYVPGATPCYRCRELTAEAESVKLSGYEAGWTDPGQAAPPLIAPTCAMVASVIALEAVRHLGGLDDSALKARYVTLDMRTWRSMAVELRRHPDCPTCLNASPHDSGGGPVHAAL